MTGGAVTKTLQVDLDCLEEDDRDDLTGQVAGLYEPADWRPDWDGIWDKSSEALEALRQFIHDLTSTGAVRWSDGGWAGLDATYDADNEGHLYDPSGFSLTIMVDGVFVGLFVTRVSDILDPATPLALESVITAVTAAANTILRTAATALSQ